MRNVFSSAHEKKITVTHASYISTVTYKQRHNHKMGNTITKRDQNTGKTVTLVTTNLAKIINPQL